MATGEGATTGCGYGPSTAPGSGCSPRWSHRPTPMTTSTGLSRWTPPSCAPTNTRPGPAKRAPAGEPADHGIGRSRGGLSTKIHLASDARCRPLAFVLTAGQAGDAPAFAHVMARLRVPRRRGRPRTRPDVVLADKAYSSHAIREHLRKRGIRAVIPVPADQRGHRLRRGSRGGRPPAFDREAYKQTRGTAHRLIGPGPPGHYSAQFQRSATTSASADRGGGPTPVGGRRERLWLFTTTTAPAPAAFSSPP
ncbi:DDE family transposase [Streptomyces sp. 3211.6]|nr:DDE family transposase [Streptomyces sp. 3211.6]